MSTRQHPEADAQKTVIEWCRWNKYPYDRIFAIENERKTTPQQGARRKAMGVREGVSDLFLPVACGKYHGLFIEMKSKKGKISAPQQAFIDDVISDGYAAKVCYSSDEAINVLINYCGEGLPFTEE